MCMCGVMSSFSFSVPLLARVSAILLPLMPMCVLTLSM